MKSTAEEMILATEELVHALKDLTFSPPVAYTYNPLIYAIEPYKQYLRLYGNSQKEVLFLGMNPGPFGMAQTGVPFGEIPAVRDWLHICAPVGKPECEHPKRPVTGFDCPRSEVSGRRLWGLFAQLYGSAENFFRNNFVANYCPLVWMSESGANITPDKLSSTDSAPVEEACLEYLIKTMRILSPSTLVGIGGYATKKLEQAAGLMPDREFTIGTLLHPSPASPMSNKNWPEMPTQQLKSLGLI